jgi:hypothetical protein
MASEEQYSPEPFEPSPVAEAFYAGAIGRITRIVPVLGAVGFGIAWWRAGGWFASGFIAGSIVSYVNFYWLKRAVETLATVTVQQGPELNELDKRIIARGAVLRFLMRYGVIGIAAYAIFRISVSSLYGMLAGLFVPAAAIVCEAAYEVYAALRRGL